MKLTMREVNICSNSSADKASVKQNRAQFIL